MNHLVIILFEPNSIKNNYGLPNHTEANYSKYQPKSTIKKGGNYIISMHLLEILRNQVK